MNKTIVVGLDQFIGVVGDSFDAADVALAQQEAEAGPARIHSRYGVKHGA